MTGVARSRSIPGYYNTGTTIKLGTRVTKTRIASFGKTCDDVVGNLTGDNPLEIVHRYSSDPILNGDNGELNWILYKDCVDLPLQVTWSGGDAIDADDYRDMVTTVLARTNPGRSVVKLPVFIFELRELPRLVKLAGDSILGKLASGNLAWNFGWRPLISDLKKMITFQESVEKRMNELDRLQSKGGLKRRLQLGGSESSEIIKSDEIWENYAVVVRGQRSLEKREKVWGTVRWKPSPYFRPFASRADQLSYARRLVFGLTAGNIADNLWEALPWSWLVDWFSNIGDYIVARQNQVAMPAGFVNIMVHRTNVMSYRVTGKPDWITVSPTSPWTATDGKFRFPYPAVPHISFSLPFLTNRQLSILGSLAILKRIPKIGR